MGRVWNGDAAARADLAVKAATSAAPAAPAPAVSASAPPAAGASALPRGTKILRLSMSPPLPPRGNSGAMPGAMVSAAAAAGAQHHAPALSTGGGAPPSTPKAAWEAGAPAGLHTSLQSHRAATRSVSATEKPWGGDAAAGRRFCDLSAHQRRFGGQLEASGGLG